MGIALGLYSVRFIQRPYGDYMGLIRFRKSIGIVLFLLFGGEGGGFTLTPGFS